MDTEGIPSVSKPVLYLCEECGKLVSNKSTLANHKKWKHEIMMERYCNFCYKTFSKKSTLTRHKKRCKGPQNATRRYNTKVLHIRCSLCDFCANSRVTVHDHYQKDHKIDLSEQQLAFDSIEDFNVWKDQFELDTKSNFVKTSGTQQGKNGTQIDKYLCHRDGNFQPKGKNIRKMKNCKSNKIGSYCPARIYVYASNKNVKIKYVGTHVGHKNEIGRLYIPKAEKERIAQNIALKIPFNEILNEIHDSIPAEPHRVHLLKRKDLWNIAKSYKLDQGAISLQNDYSCADPRVCSSSPNLVRFYKTEEEHFEILHEVKTECEDVMM